MRKHGSCSSSERESGNKAAYIKLMSQGRTDLSEENYTERNEYRMKHYTMTIYSYVNNLGSFQCNSALILCN